jgi:hypothetical protein
MGEHFARAVTAKDSSAIRSLLAEEMDFGVLT